MCFWNIYTLFLYFCIFFAIPLFLQSIILWLNLPSFLFLINMPYFTGSKYIELTSRHFTFYEELLV